VGGKETDDLAENLNGLVGLYYRIVKGIEGVYILETRAGLPRAS